MWLDVNKTDEEKIGIRVNGSVIFNDNSDTTPPAPAVGPVITSVETNSLVFPGDDLVVTVITDTTIPGQWVQLNAPSGTWYGQEVLAQEDGTGKAVTTLPATPDLIGTWTAYPFYAEPLPSGTTFEVTAS